MISQRAAKILITIAAIITMLLGIWTFAKAEPSQAFQTAKDWAMTVKHENGSYGYSVTLTVNDQKIKYTVIYLPGIKAIGGKVESEGVTAIIMFEEETGQYTKALYLWDDLLTEEGAFQEEADEMMNYILDHLIQKRVI